MAKRSRFTEALTEAMQTDQFRGDWHSKLLSALSFAKSEAKSQDFLEAIDIFTEIVEEHDECIHTVTINLPIPVGVSADYLKERVLEFFDAKIFKVELPNSWTIALTWTARGSQKFVENKAKALLEYALNEVKLEINS